MPATSTIPPGVEKPFVENDSAVRALRVWVPDKLPADTKLLNYHTEDAWDGTKFEEWLMNSASGFEMLTQRIHFNVAQSPEDIELSYKIAEPRLKEIGVVLGGHRPPRVPSLDWSKTNKTTVQGQILPHAAGEILHITRVTVK